MAARVAAALKQKFVPVLDKVLLEKIDLNDMNSSGIILPARMMFHRCVPARVVAVGPGKLGTTGKLIPNSVKEGDTVLLPDHPGTTVRMFEREFELYDDEDIVAIVSEDLFTKSPL